jgi:CheY-like chemotaxis protein
LKSEIDKGSVFYFTIPYKPGTRVDKLPKIQYDTNFKWMGKTILIAEDEDINYNLLETIIKPTGAVIIRAKTGQEAVDICLGGKKIHMVLMDIKMPDMNGLEATKKIKNIHKDLPVIAQTAYAMSTDEDNCLRAGCDAYLSKPLKVEEILSVINQYLVPDSKISTSKKSKVTQSN